MNARRSSSNLLAEEERRKREEETGEKREGKAGIGGEKEDLQPEVPLWKQVSDCSEKPASSVSPLPEHDREELATLRALLLTCSSMLVVPCRFDEVLRFNRFTVRMKTIASPRG